ncbi:MAG: ATP-binding protein, partial [Rhodospirillaceae bacterium]
MSNERNAIRVFISSPSDVRPERLIAERVVQRLDKEFAYHFRVEPVLWEREPLVATRHFQDFENIPPPSTTDIVVVILWSRLGVPLPMEKFAGAVSGKVPVTGTEWEFEDALKSHRESETSLPELLMYRKKADVTSSLEDVAVVHERLAQKQYVEDFMSRWFMSAEGTEFTAASHIFEDATAFEDKLETHLRALLKKRLANPDEEVSPAGIRWHQGSPFRGLLSYDLEHAPVFFGRTRARNELRELLSRRAEAGNAFVLVVGASGSGKSSLVRAGLLSDLTLPGMVGRVALVRHAVFRPSDQGGDLLKALAASMLATTALPELAAPPLSDTVDSLAALLREAPGQAARPIRQGLAVAGQAAGLTELGEARLLVVVDQLEEMFTQDTVAPEAREGFVAALEALAGSGLVWVVATLRSDFFDRLETLPRLAQLSDGARYLLVPNEPAEIGQIIRQPAREAGLRFEVDAARAVGLDEVIREAMARDAGALPLLSFLLDQLWQRRSEAGVLGFAAYQGLGGLEGALGQRAEEVFSALPKPVRDELPAVLRLLVTVAAGAKPTARTALLSAFPAGTPRRALVEALLHPEARLLVADGDAEAAPRVRVAHEALLSHWATAAQQIAKDARDLELRGRLEQAAERWGEATRRDRESLVLAAGLPLQEALDLVKRWGADLSAEI